MKRREFLDLSAKTTLLACLNGNFCLNAAYATTTKTGLLLDDDFILHHISPDHPESPRRYLAIRQKIVDLGLIEQTVAIQPRQDIENWLPLVHSESHIKAIKSGYGDTHHYVSKATAGVLGAIDQVCTGHIGNAFCASRPPGHHAMNTGREEGFCYYNHIAIAARYAQHQYKIKKILIVDWDYHHGNGTEAVFYNDPDVLFFSTHDYYAYPLTGDPARRGEGAGEGYTINVHMDCGDGDMEFIDVFNSMLVPAADKFEPELILISAGFDSREDDLLGCHKVTDQGYAKLTRIVKQLADKHCQGRLVSILEGGYNIAGNASASAAHLSALMEDE